MDRAPPLSPDDAPPEHPAAALFPRLAGADLDALAADIAANGLLGPVVLLDGAVLDGRNRLAACALAGVEPLFTEYVGDDPVSWVVSQNLHRRHLSESQRAMVAARLAKLPRGANQHRQICLSRTQPEAAELLNVSPRTVKSARVVQQQGVPALVDAVDAGAVAVSAAAKIARLPPEEQAGVVARGEAEVLRVAKEIRNQRREERRAARAARVVAEAEPLDAPGVSFVVGDAAGSLRGLDAASAGLVHADPPWSYDNQRLHGTSEGHYSLDGMAGVVATLNEAYRVAADDCYLLCWATFPLLAEWFAASADLLWTYKSGAAWLKTGGRPGIGFHWRGRSEPLLLYTKGSPKPFDTMVKAGHSSEVGEHSEKPEGWLRGLVAGFAPTALPVLDVYSGRAPLARACLDAGRDYVGLELSAERVAEARRAIRLR